MTTWKGGMSMEELNKVIERRSPSSPKQMEGHLNLREKILRERKAAFDALAQY